MSLWKGKVRPHLGFFFIESKDTLMHCEILVLNFICTKVSSAHAFFLSLHVHPYFPSSMLCM